jgi:hypothetical protein
MIRGNEFHGFFATARAQTWSCDRWCDVIQPGRAQIDIIRLLGGGLVRNVCAHRRVGSAHALLKAHYSLLLGFEGVLPQPLTADMVILILTGLMMNNVGWGNTKSTADYGGARQRLTQTEDETALKAARNWQQCLPAAAQKAWPPALVGSSSAVMMG